VWEGPTAPGLAAPEVGRAPGGRALGGPRRRSRSGYHTPNPAETGLPRSRRPGLAWARGDASRRHPPGDDGGSGEYRDRGGWPDIHHLCRDAAFLVAEAAWTRDLIGWGGVGTEIGTGTLGDTTGAVGAGIALMAKPKLGTGWALGETITR